MGWRRGELYMTFQPALSDFFTQFDGWFWKIAGIGSQTPNG